MQENRGLVTDFGKGDNADVVDRKIMTADDVNERSGNTDAETSHELEKGRTTRCLFITSKTIMKSKLFKTHFR